VVEAVKGVSLAIPREHTVGLVGESGSGKTTVARLALRLVDPTSGRLTFDGTDLLRTSRSEMRALRRRMQIIFQDPYASLDPRMQVGETVGEAQVYGGAKSGVALKAKGPISIFVPITNRDRLTARIVYQGPVMAPVEEGAPIGSLRVSIGDTLSQETPLYAAESVETGALHQRALDAVGELLVGWLR
jgi:ABC-type dipeptide/oligopeptide/nickel transport system ATPase subunit